MEYFTEEDSATTIAVLANTTLEEAKQYLTLCVLPEDRTKVMQGCLALFNALAFQPETEEWKVTITGHSQDKSWGYISMPAFDMKCYWVYDWAEDLPEPENMVIPDHLLVLITAYHYANVERFGKGEHAT